MKKLSVNNLTYYYKGAKIPVLRDFSCDFEQGKVTCIIGANGSGKSTLANILAGLYKIKKPSSAKLQLDSRIGIVFQNPNVQVLFDTVLEEFEFILGNYNIEKTQWTNLVDNALEKVGLNGISDIKKANPLYFSLGQKQRLAIAQMLAINPDFIVFDEATAMLDVWAKEQVIEIYNELRNSGIGVILVTNVIDEVLIADKTVVLQSNYDYRIINGKTSENTAKLVESFSKIGFTLTPLWQLVAIANAIEYKQSDYQKSKLPSKQNVQQELAKNTLSMLNSPLLRHFLD